MPGTTIARRQLMESVNPKATNRAKISGIAICVTPPPRLPQPAVVAFAVPTTLGAKVIVVWYWVMTKLAPIAPIASRNSRNEV